MNLCLNCQAGTRTKFCSRSCSTSYNNRLKPKRKKRELRCQICDLPISRGKYHKICFVDRFSLDYSVVTLEDSQERLGSRNSYITRVRQHARSVAMRAGKLDTCFICGYSLFVECCHIKPVSGFSLSTTLSEVNHESNLIGLCPNHHWELDNGLLQV